MFGFFKKKLSIDEYVNAAEILPVAENGDYKAFLIRIDESSKELSAVLKDQGGKNALEKLVEVIESRIDKGDFENIFDEADKMISECGLDPVIRNRNVDRIVICNDSQGYVFKWNPND